MGCNASRQVGDESSTLHGRTTTSRGGGSKPEESANANHDEVISAALRSKRAAKRDNVFAESVAIDGDSAPPSKRVYPKSDQSRDLIRRSLSKNFLFADLAEAEIISIIDAMEEKNLQGDQLVIQQGDKGDYFYVVETGDFDVFVDDKKVYQYTVGGSFGELALLYNCPRAATVKARTAAKVWMLDRVIFRYLVASKQQQLQTDIVAMLRRVPILETLTLEQLSKTADAIQIVRFQAGDIILRKGDEGNVLYFIKEGAVDCADIGNGQKEVVTLREGDYFGERALLKNEPRAANVTARSRVTLYALDRESFQEILGPLKELLDFNLSIRVLKSVPLLKGLSDEERNKLVSHFALETYKQNDLIIRYGEAGNKFYILKAGTVSVEKQAAKVSIAQLSSGDYFGEMAILQSEPRKADVVVTSPVAEVMALDRAKFVEVLGPLQDILARESKKRGDEIQSKLSQDISLDDLEFHGVLGTGTFGTVKLARQKKTGEVYALKIMHKQQLVDFKQTKNVVNEKKVMLMADHPFILRLIATFKNQNYLYMLLEFVQGGELFSYLHCSNRDTEYIPNDTARFYAAQVLDALHYLHDKRIVYRDLKPENIMIDHRGYVKVVDFGFARVVEDRTYTLCGTPEYLAPEIVLGRGHNKAVDYWAIGVLIYEMLLGYSPFAGLEGADQVTICRNIVNGRVEFPNDIPVLDSAKDIIRKLLTKEPSKRIGCLKRGADEIKSHEWFAELDWAKLRKRELRAPWVPKVRNPLDTSHFDSHDQEMDLGDYVPDGTNWEDEF